jgi:hypothetical protein
MKRSTVSSGTENKDIHIHMADRMVETDDGLKSIEDFVVWQNKRLTDQLDELSKHMNEITTERDEMKNDYDKLSTSCRYLKGMLKNSIQSSNTQVSIKNIYKDLYEQNLKYFNTCIHAFDSISIKFSVFIICTSILRIWNFGEYKNATILMTIGCIVLYFNYIITRFLNKFISIPSDTIMRLESMQKELKSIQESQDFLNDYIDSI